VYIEKFSGDVCISTEFLSEISYIFSVKLCAIFFNESLVALESQITLILDVDCLFTRPAWARPLLQCCNTSTSLLTQTKKMFEL
jgi:hypothetical protein